MWLVNLWQIFWTFLKTWLPLIATLIVLRIIFYILIFTNVAEGTVKALMTREGFNKLIMSWKGYKFDKDWNVVEGTEERLLPGGLRFVGFRWIDSVYKYNFRWRDLHLAEGGSETVQFHQKLIDYILVKPDVYFTDIEKAETKPPERIPLNIQFLVTIRVINPYKALFKAPPNWNENIIMRLNAHFRNWVSTKKLDDLFKLYKDKAPRKTWEELGTNPLLQMFSDEWGVQIEENGIEIRDIGLPPGYQEPAARRRQMELEAEGRAADTVGTVIEMMARAQGKTPKKIQKEIGQDEALKKEFLAMSKDLMVRKMGIEGGAYVDIRVDGAEGLERTILNALAVWQKTPKGKKETGRNTKVKITKEGVEEERKRFGETIRRG